MCWEYVCRESLDVLVSLERACDVYDDERMTWSLKSKIRNHGCCYTI